MAEAYLRHVAATVKLLSRYGIYTLLDMHQDVYNQSFRGEGAPDWAVCTDGVPIVPTGGRWSNNYANPQLDTAVHHFWTNDVVGNLQGQFDLVWATVASYFKNNPWVVGYDPYNEPFSTETQTGAAVHVYRQPGVLLHREGPHGLPGQRGHTSGVPRRRAEQRSHPVDPGRRPPPPDLRRAGHLLGDGWERPLPARADAVPAGRLQLPRLLRRPQPGDRQSDQSLRCLQSEETAASEQDITRLSMSSQYQSSGPAIFMSEFGATTSTALVGFDTEWAGSERGRLGVLGLEVLRRPHRVLGRGSRPARRELLADRDGSLTDIPAGSGRHRHTRSCSTPSPVRST